MFTTYGEVCKCYGFNVNKTWLFSYGLSTKNNEYRYQYILEPTGEDAILTDLEFCLFFSLDNSPKGFLPNGDTFFVHKGKIVIGKANPFYAPELVDSEEAEQSIVHNNPFSVKRYLDQLELAKREVLFRLSDNLEDDENNENWEVFETLLDEFYFEYLTQFITTEENLVFIKYYENMERQLELAGVEPKKIITKWINP